MDTVKCYAAYRNYKYFFLDTSSNHTDSQRCNHTQFFFKRHCIAARIGERNPDIDWLLFIDADHGVINPTHPLQDYIPKSGAEIVFHERIMNQEIAAGTYFFRNAKYARDMIDYWADYEFHLPKSFHGTDNGAIHAVFLEYLLPTTDRSVCERVWENSSNWDTMMDFVTCTRWVMGELSDFDSGRVHLIKKGQKSWSRDGWLTGWRWSPGDFFIHALQVREKEEYPPVFLKNHVFNLSTCTTPNALHNWAYNKTKMVTDEDIKKTIGTWIHDQHKRFMDNLQTVFEFRDP
ncbi:hypothetical protein L596_020490 [Steinernema carpocapsae]|nr:hypothetical protein L596_020490 [Steinernema carpocapsae]